MVGTKQEKYGHKDVSKQALIFPKFLLRSISLWPEKQDRINVIFVWMLLVSLMLFGAGQAMYLVVNLGDLTAVTGVMFTLSTTMQAMCKVAIVFIYSKQLNGILQTISNEFWVSSCLGLEIEKTLVFGSRLTSSSMLMVLASCIVFAVSFLSGPLVEGSRTLPFSSWYPFNWQRSPLYEILYILHCFMDVFGIILPICGHDDLFLALCINCINQFKMLKQAVARIGTEDGKIFYENLNKGKTRKCMRYEEKQLLVTCVQHHVKLITVCNEIDKVFSKSNMLLLLTSSVEICVSSFLIVMTEQTQIVHLTSYCLGHVLQLFMICAGGNELSYQSQSLSTYVLSGGWYRKENLELKKDLIMVTLASQKPIRMSAFVANLNYSTFIAVMRLSFSFYTFLSTLVQK